jgi:hypothetical protein
MNCPKCQTEMHTNVILIWDSKKTRKIYQECSKCNFKTTPKTAKKGS